MLSNCGAGEGSWESLGLQGDQITVNPKGNVSLTFFGRTNAEADAPILWPPDGKGRLTGKASDAGRDWRQKEKGAAEDERVRQYHQFNEHEFEQTPGDSGGERSLVCPWGCKKLDTISDWTTTTTTFNHSWLERSSRIICSWFKKNAFIHLLSFPS